MKTIVVIGCGALGSHAIQFLRNDAAIRAVDFDRVETRNTQAQFHTLMGVRKNKAESLKSLMMMAFGSKLETRPFKMTADNVQELCVGANLVIDAMDNGASRRVLRTFTHFKGLPCLHGAIDADGTFGRVIWDEHFVVDDEDAPGAPTCEGGEHLPFIASVGAFLARAAQAFLTKGERVGFHITPRGVLRIEP
jgi:molybdopterin/thiamine biosynthesis adenylyltransferase